MVATNNFGLFHLLIRRFTSSTSISINIISSGVKRLFFLINFKICSFTSLNISPLVASATYNLSTVPFFARILRIYCDFMKFITYQKTLFHDRRELYFITLLFVQSERLSLMTPLDTIVSSAWYTLSDFEEP